MIDHTGIGAADMTRSAVFYDAALGALGLRRVLQMPPDIGTDGIGYGDEFPVFWIIDSIHMASDNTLLLSLRTAIRWTPFMPRR